jgi:hypothetical protein
VYRGSDSSTALRVQNSGEVVVQNNYLYASGSGTSLYVQNGAVMRGNISNDSGNVTVADNLDVTGDVTINGSHLTLANGTTSAQSTDYLYIGGSNLASADAAIYIGNQGAGGGYGYRIYYSGVGTGNNNKLILKSENLGSEVDMLTFTADGNATFSNDVTINGGDLTIAKQNDAPTMTLLHDGTNPSTNDLLFKMQFQSDYNGSHQNWGKIEVDTNASAVRTNMDFYVKSSGGNEQLALRLEGQSSAVPNATFSGDVLAQGLYVGSANTSFDFYNNGTSYLNGATTIDANLDVTSGGRVKVSGGNTDQYYFEGQRNGVGVTYRLYDNSNNVYHDSYTSQVFRLNQNGGSGGNLIITGGNVGIGETNPESILHIKDTNAEIRVATAADGQTARIALTEDADGDTHGGYMQYVGGGDTLRLGIINSGTNTDVITIKDNFNVGIGTTSPDETFQVVGSVQFGVDGAVSDGGKLKIRHDGDSFISMVRSGIHTWRHMITDAGTYILKDVDNGVNPIEITESDCIETNVPVVGTNIGRNNDDQVLFAITEHDTSESIRRKFGNTSLTAITKVDDSTAPADGCFQLTNQYYNITIPEFFKVDTNSEYTFEVWVKFVSGSDTDQRLYAGSSFYDSSKSYLGNSQRYWGAVAVQVDANSRSDGQWYHCSGTLGPDRGTSTGDIPNSAEWMKLILLLNYSSNANTVRFCGLKFYKSGARQNRMFTSIYRKPLGTASGGADSWSGATVMDTNGYLYTPAWLYHYNDTNSYLGWGSGDDFQIFVGGDELMRFDEGASGEHIRMFKNLFRFDDDKFQITTGKLNVNNQFLNSRVEIYDASTARIRINSGNNNAGITLTESGSDKWQIYSSSSNFYIYNNANRLQIDSGGRVGINITPSTAARFYVNDNSLYAGKFEFNGTSGSYGSLECRISGGSTSPAFIDFKYGSSQVGSIVTTGSGTIYLTSSDYRLKENAVELTGALDRLDNLQPKRFNFISHPNETVDGFMAHEVSDVVPEAVRGTKDAVDDNGDIIPQGIDQSKLVPLLVAAVKELKAEVESLRNQINS